MGNSQCVPYPYGEDLKEFLRRKFRYVSRRRRIDDLVTFAILGEEKEFKRVAGRMKLTQRELDRFYEERDAVLDEFAEDAIEIELCRLGHETPSEYSYAVGSDSSDGSETTSYCPLVDFTPVAPIYSDPVNQRMFEELCRQAWQKELGLISESDLPELGDEYGKTPYRRMSRTQQYNKDNVALEKDAYEDKYNKCVQEKAREKGSKLPEHDNNMSSEMGAGENFKTTGKSTVQSTSILTDFGDNGKKKVIGQTDRAEIRWANLTQSRSYCQSLNRKCGFLEKITEGLRAQSRNPSRTPSRASTRMSVKESTPSRSSTRMSLKDSEFTESELSYSKWMDSDSTELSSRCSLATESMDSLSVELSSSYSKATWRIDSVSDELSLQCSKATDLKESVSVGLLSRGSETTVLYLENDRSTEVSCEKNEKNEGIVTSVASKDGDTDVSKEVKVETESPKTCIVTENKADKKKGFFRRLVARFRKRFTKSVSPKSMVHEKQAPSDTESMPL